MGAHWARKCPHDAFPNVSKYRLADKPTTCVIRCSLVIQLSIGYCPNLPAVQHGPDLGKLRARMWRVKAGDFAIFMTTPANVQPATLYYVSTYVKKNKQTWEPTPARPLHAQAR